MVTPEFPCKDCGTNTVPLEGNREYYEVQDQLWNEIAQAPGIGQSDNGPEGFFLCIGCLEERISRKLTPDDFKAFPANVPSPWYSDRLNDRLSDGIWTVRPKILVAQFFPCALADAIDERFKPLKIHKTPTGAVCWGRRERSDSKAG
jgi:hypothetical protein